MIKTELAKHVKEALGLKSNKEAGEFVNKLADLIAKLVKEGNEIPFGDLGRFVPAIQAARRCNNPRTNEMMDVPAKKVMRFKVSLPAKRFFSE